MRESGCAEVLIGFESPTRDGLHGLELRRNWKERQFPRYRQAIEQIQTRGIRVNACFVVGLDDHGPEVFDALYNFVEEVVPYDVQVTYPTPFPGTPLYGRLEREGRLLEPAAWEKCTLFDINFRPAHLSVEQFRRGFHELVSRLYSDSFTRYRQDHFDTLRRARKLPHRTADPHPIQSRSAECVLQ